MELRQLMYIFFTIIYRDWKIIIFLPMNLYKFQITPIFLQFSWKEKLVHVINMLL